MTVEEFAGLAPHPLYRYELVRGRLVREPRPFSDHGWLVLRLGRHLVEHVERGRLGVVTTESGYRLAPDEATVRGPDLAFVSRVRAPGLPAASYPAVAPDLVVEVLSPSDRARVVAAKVAEYLGAGVRLVWIVDPRARQVRVHRPGGVVTVLGAAAELDGGDVLPGFTLSLSAIFEV